MPFKIQTSNELAATRPAASLSCSFRLPVFSAPASVSAADAEAAAPVVPLREPHVAVDARRAAALAVAPRAGSLSAPDDWLPGERVPGGSAGPQADGYWMAALPGGHSCLLASPAAERDGWPEDDLAPAGCWVELDDCSAAALRADGSAPLAALDGSAPPRADDYSAAARMANGHSLLVAEPDGLAPDDYCSPDGFPDDCSAGAASAAAPVDSAAPQADDFAPPESPDAGWEPVDWAPADWAHDSPVD